MTAPRGPLAFDDGYGFGDITAGSITSWSVLSLDPNDPKAERREREVEADRQHALARLAEQAADGGSVAAAGPGSPGGRPVVAVPARRSPTANREPAARQPALRPAATRQLAATPVARPPATQRPRQAPPLAGPPVTRRGQAGLGSRVVQQASAAGRSGGLVRRSDGLVRTTASRAAASSRPAGGRRSRSPLVALVFIAVVIFLVARALHR